MKLFVDIGNTAIKWTSETELQSQIIHRANSHQLPEAIELDWMEMVEPTEVHIASVRHQKIVDSLTMWIAQHWQSSVRESETKHQELGVTNGYTTPKQLGVDRWLALLAAHDIGTRPKLVVDCGSATTIDGLKGDGCHLGGVILPGLQLYSNCLDLNTDLTIDDKELKVKEFSTDTATGVLSGAMLMHLCMIERLFRNLEARCEENAECIITGGNAQLLSEYLKIPHKLKPDLVLRGLALQSAQAN